MFVVIGSCQLVRGGLSVVSPLAVTVGTAALTYGARPLQLVWLPSTVTYVDRLEPSAFVPALVMAIAFLGCFACGYALSAGVGRLTGYPSHGGTLVRCASKARNRHVGIGGVQPCTRSCFVRVASLYWGPNLAGAVPVAIVDRRPVFYVSGGALVGVCGRLFTSASFMPLPRGDEERSSVAVGRSVTLSFLLGPTGRGGLDRPTSRFHLGS